MLPLGLPPEGTPVFRFKLTCFIFGMIRRTRSSPAPHRLGVTIPRSINRIPSRLLASNIIEVESASHPPQDELEKLHCGLTANQS